MLNRTTHAHLMALAILSLSTLFSVSVIAAVPRQAGTILSTPPTYDCLLYTSDAADE